MGRVTYSVLVEGSYCCEHCLFLELNGRAKCRRFERIQLLEREDQANNCLRYHRCTECVDTFGS